MHEEMKPRERMLAAIRQEPADRYAVAPELWYYIPARVLGMNLIDFFDVPHWKALQQSFKYYDCEGYGCVGPEPPAWPDTRRVQVSPQ